MPRRPGARPPARPALPTVHLSRDHHRAVVAELRRSKAWTRVRPGASIDTDLLRGPDSARLLALARIAALDRQLTADVVVSHTSAALLWGLPTLRVPATTHVIEPGHPRPSASPDVTRHRHRIDPADVTELDGIRVTTLERTVVDCTMSEPASGGLVVADAALHRGADREQCVRLLASMVGRRGVVRARAVLELADEGAESAGESLARHALLAAGLPRPVTQVPVTTRIGVFWGDVGWPEHRALVEYDGRGKYDGAGVDVVLAEKRREDALLDAGWRLARVTAEDLRRPEATALRVLRLLPGASLEPRPVLHTR